MSSLSFGKTALGVARVWRHVDVASDPRPIGRLAQAIATTLTGKHKPTYWPGSDIGDYVVVTNCQYAYFTGKKEQYKIYYRHSGRPGNLHKTTAREMRENKGGSELLRRAVFGMLPKDSNRKKRMSRLKLCEDSTNPWAANIIAFHDDAVTLSELRDESKAEANPPETTSQ